MVDISKFKKMVSKTITNGSIGFHDPKTWVSSGSYALNYTMSGDFKKGFPMGKFSLVAGASGSGKSYIVSGNAVRNAQKMGIFVVLIDTENALDEEWLHNLGVDTSEDKLMKLNIAMIDDVAKIISEFIEEYKKDPIEEREKVLFVIDSLGMLMTPTDVAHFEKGDLKGDMGRKPKALKALITNCVNMIGELDIGMVATNHTYQSQDMFNPDAIVAGGSGQEFAASIQIVMEKSKLKVDENGDKVSDILGIRSRVMCRKTRFNKPFEQVKIDIPYQTGMNPYSGLIEMFEEKGLLVKVGNKLAYTDLDGVTDSWFRKQIIKDTTILDKIMKEFPEQMEKMGKDHRGKIIEITTDDVEKLETE